MNGPIPDLSCSFNFLEFLRHEEFTRKKFSGDAPDAVS